MPKQANQAKQHSRMAKTKPALSPLAASIKLGVLSLGLAGGSGMLSGTSQAANIEVTSNLDNGTGCTLREAVDSVNSEQLAPGCGVTGPSLGTNDTITFSDNLALSNTITLTNGQLSVEPGTSVTITANNIAGGITIDGSNNGSESRIFRVLRATLTTASISLTNAEAPVFATDSDVTINNASITGHYTGIHAETSNITINFSTIDRRLLSIRPWHRGFIRICFNSKTNICVEQLL